MQYNPYEVISGESSKVYEFVSFGNNGPVKKLVVHSSTNLHNFFNLGFGDKDELTGEIDDLVVTNNGDSLRVMATVASTIYLFTDEFPDAMIFAVGSTKSRTRLYRMGISNNLETINIDFEVYGLVGDAWEEFVPGCEYQAFFVKRKYK
nr:hypothetical protein [uncultured Dyadobacter sp.]